jgi:polysaccharide export outer membrane protein
MAMNATGPEATRNDRSGRRGGRAGRRATDGALLLVAFVVLGLSLPGCFEQNQAGIHPSITLVPFDDETPVAREAADEPLVTPAPTDRSIATAHPYHWARAFGFASAEDYYRARYGSVPERPLMAEVRRAAPAPRSRAAEYTDESGVTWRRTGRRVEPDAFELRRTAAAPRPAAETAGQRLAAAALPAGAPLTGAGAGSDAEQLPPPPPSAPTADATGPSTGGAEETATVGALPASLDVEPAAQTAGTEDEVRTIAPSRAIEAFDEGGDDSYRMGPGDAIEIEAWDNTEISGQHFIGPDGKITLPIVGPFKIAGMTREEAAEAVTANYEDLYYDLSITIRVLQYNANKVFMLGAVRQPGVIRFEDTPTLLDAITRAGGVISSTTTQQVLPSCAVMRGNDRIAWISLQELLGNGVLSLNIRLHPNDTVYVPDWKQKQVFVMGSVAAPGMYAITPDMTVLDALGRAGGPTLNAAPGRIWLIRPSEEMKQLIDFEDPRDMTPLLQARIEPGDILFVPQNRIAKFSYVVSNLTPQSWFYFGEDIISGDFDNTDD